MVELQEHIEALAAAEIRVVAISYDSVEVLSEFAKRAKIGFPLLSDDESKVIDAFRVRNKRAKAGSRQDGIPHPGTFVLDADGVVVAKIPGTVRERHTSEELMDVVKKLRQAEE